MTTEGPMTIAIVYDQPGNMFPAGETVSGHVVLQVVQPVTLGGVRIYFHGKGRVSWSSFAKMNTAREIYLSEARELLDAGSSMYTSLILVPGIFRYPFSLWLPPDLPASYRGSHGFVRYRAKVTVEGSWKAIMSCVESDFLVCRSVDLNREPARLWAPVQMQKEMNVSGGCYGSGYVIAEMVVDRRCFVPGEKILLSGSVENMTNARVRRTMVAIVQKITLHKYPKKHELKRTVSKVNGPSVPPYEKSFWENVELVVPFVPMSRMDGCSLIDIEYWIEVFVDFNLPCASISRKLKSIVIGNVPLHPTAQSTATRTSQRVSSTMAKSETNITQRPRTGDHLPETNTQGPPPGSWGTQWDMIHWMSSATTNPSETESNFAGQPPTTINSHAGQPKDSNSFPLTPIHHHPTIAEIHEEPKTAADDDDDDD